MYDNRVAMGIKADGGGERSVGVSEPQRHAVSVGCNAVAEADAAAAALGQLSKTIDGRNAPRGPRNMGKACSIFEIIVDDTPATRPSCSGRREISTAALAGTFAGAD